MSRYSQTFTLSEILTHPALKDKLPNVFKSTEFTDDSGKSNYTKGQIIDFVEKIAEKSADMHFNNYSIYTLGEQIIISGDNEDAIDTVVEEIYNEINGKKAIIRTIARNIGIIRDAYAESVEQKYATGGEPKLYLKEKSMTEISNMDPLQFNAFLHEIIDNIFYNDDFSGTQAKNNLYSVIINGKRGKEMFYYDRKTKWEKDVGIFPGSQE